MKIKINDKEIDVEEDQSILNIAEKNGISIPKLCYHPDLTAKGKCGLCVVNIKNKGIVKACQTKVEEGMEIETNSPEVLETRQKNLKLIKEKQAGNNQDKFNFNSSISFDRSKCIQCSNCIEACAKFSCSFLEAEQSDNAIKIIPSKNPKKDCIYCGQCANHCPVKVFTEKDDTEKVEASIADKNKIVVFQFAPSIRVSIGEEFNLPYGQIVTDQLSAAIRALGANFVFDTSVGADFTTVEEAKELVKKITPKDKEDKKCQLLLSSCCPSWVKYVEFYYPEFVENLASARSPQIILGGLIKNYWAKQKNIDPKNIVIVSVMPCTSKKYEITINDIKINNVQPVDFVITTRELAKMLKNHKIDLANIKPESADNPLGKPTGAGVIFGASGGVMEAALRTGYKELTGKELPKEIFSKVRGTQGIKTAEIEINDAKIKIAVVNGIPNAKKILEELKKDPKAYSCVEVMACPGGCIGGGGQLLPTSDEIRKKRTAALYTIDQGDKIKYAHENPILKEIYKEYLNNEETIKTICHREFHKKSKEVNI